MQRALPDTHENRTSYVALPTKRMSHTSRQKHLQQNDDDMHKASLAAPARRKSDNDYAHQVPWSSQPEEERTLRMLRQQQELYKEGQSTLLLKKKTAKKKMPQQQSAYRNGALQGPTSSPPGVSTSTGQEPSSAASPRYEYTTFPGAEAIDGTTEEGDETLWSPEQPSSQQSSRECDEEEILVSAEAVTESREGLRHLPLILATPSEENPNIRKLYIFGCAAVLLILLVLVAVIVVVVMLTSSSSSVLAPSLGAPPGDTSPTLEPAVQTTPAPVSHMTPSAPASSTPIPTSASSNATRMTGQEAYNFFLPQAVQWQYKPSTGLMLKVEQTIGFLDSGRPQPSSPWICNITTGLRLRMSLLYQCPMRVLLGMM